MNNNQLYLEINVLQITDWAVAFGKLKEQKIEEQQKDISGRKWTPGEMLRRKIGGKQNNSRK